MTTPQILRGWGLVVPWRRRTARALACHLKAPSRVARGPQRRYFCSPTPPPTITTPASPSSMPLPTGEPSSLTSSSTAQLDPIDERIISALVVNRPGTLAQLADVFGYADQNISGLCVRSTLVPELSRVTITCRLRESELAGVKRRLRALVSVTFFHITTMRSCVDNQELILRSQALIQLEPTPNVSTLESLLEAYGAEVVGEIEGGGAVIPDEGLRTEQTDAINYDRDLATLPTAAAPIFLHMTDEPARIDAFIAALQQQGLALRELQICGPLFLDASQSTLEAARKSSFTRRVSEEVERLMHGDEVEPPLPPVKYRIEGLDDGEDEDEDDLDLDEVYGHTHPGHTHQRLRRHRSSRPLSTFQLHANEQGHFSAKRLKLHARIAHQLYESAPQNVTRPKFVLLIGVPGAGKSTILSHLDTTGELKLADFVNFDVDDVIAMLPEFYHAMLNIGLGNTPDDEDDLQAPARDHPRNDDENVNNNNNDDDDGRDDRTAAEGPRRKKRLPAPQLRYQLCRDEARFILRKNLHSAIMCRRNIILHGTGKSFTEYATLIDQVQAAGFNVHVVCLDIPLEVAYERVEKRSNGYGRDVPRLLIDFTASLITRNFRRLAARVPNAHLFASDELPPRLVWSKQRTEVIQSNAEDPVQQKYELW